ncbi:MAG: tRNA 2-thiocytidine biosynthesis protein TtcA [Methanomassiliicoccales archaeon PtaU1.Bin124]|nr:MAG: tRNA 2-thiocytidine biosynthesis protein TtcA [Methanomassiliicoccales archaeon PtaU1.Bin124]
MASCSKCKNEAVTLIRYNGTLLCTKHFIDFVERRVKREIRQQLEIRGDVRIAVGVSGGKDSIATMELLHDILGDRRDVELLSITVDEGILGYRPETISLAKAQADRLGIEHHVISFSEVAGMDLDTMAEIASDRTPCSYCGVFRRRALNLKAKELCVDVLATGHNLDDTAQSILMNFMRGDVERLARLGPHSKVQPGLIPRIEPLRQVPEKECMLYAMLRELEFSDAECPYATSALRNEYRGIIDSMEAKHPGTKHSIVASYDAIRPALGSTFPPAELGLCSCGEPTKNEKCMACAMLQEMKEKKG